MGDIVGIEISLDGVVVLDVAEVNGAASPAGNAGLRSGDVIEQIDATPVRSVEEVRAALAACDGGEVQILARRDGQLRQFAVKPETGADGSPEIGVWLRDAMAGMGTLTFYDPASGTFAALGHAISEVDTGVLVPVRDGSVLQADVTEIVAGKPGAPGQLQGLFDAEDAIGSVERNTEEGIFGHLSAPLPGERTALPVAEEAEIETGPASLLSAIDGELRTYEIEIIRVYKGPESGNRSMMIAVTDPDLLALSGGIVQGMSGSPIVQNGKLVGAVTHVLLNDPARGYGISVEDMLAAA